MRSWAATGSPGSWREAGEIVQYNGGGDDFHEVATGRQLLHIMQGGQVPEGHSKNYRQGGQRLGESSLLRRQVQHNLKGGPRALGCLGDRT